MSFKKFLNKKGAGILAYSLEDKCFLLGKRSKNVKDPFKWNIPGGGLNPNETAKEGAIREFREETGYKGPLNPKLIKIYHGHNFEFHIFLQILKEKFTPNPKGKFAEETEAFIWIKLKDIKNLNPKYYSLSFIEPYLQKIINNI